MSSATFFAAPTISASGGGAPTNGGEVELAQHQRNHSHPTKCCQTLSDTKCWYVHRDCGSSCDRPSRSLGSRWACSRFATRSCWSTLHTCNQTSTSSGNHGNLNPTQSK